MSDGTRIWIVDDSRSHGLRAASALSGYRVETFLDAESMLERLAHEGAPDVLVLDWHLAGISGLEACRFVRKTHDEVSLPIIVVTVRDAPEDLHDAFAAGASDYVTKPYQDAELQLRVRAQARIREQGRALRARERELRGVADNLPDILARFDRGLRHVFVNAAVERATGRPSADFLGRSNRELGMPPALCDRWDAALLAVFESARAETLEFSYELDGETRSFVSRLVPEFDDAGRVETVLCITQDVTVRRQIEEALRTSEQQFRSIAEFSQTVLGIVSHDLRNPLHAITLAVQVLRLTGAPDERTSKGLDRIQSATRQATALIHDLLDLTRASVGGGIPIAPRDADLAEIAKSVADDLSPLHRERRVELHHAGDTRGRWDPERLRQVVTNLVGNALKYSPAGGLVELAAEGDGQGVLLRVRNQGPLIPADRLGRLFEPFVRGTDEGANVDRSVGLGLFIVRHVVQRHGGTIEVTSTEQQGTTFLVRLPRAPALD